MNLLRMHPDVENDTDYELRNFHLQMEYSSQMYQYAVLKMAADRIRLEYAHQNKSPKESLRTRVLRIAYMLFRRIARRVIIKFFPSMLYEEVCLEPNLTKPEIIDVTPVAIDDEEYSHG